MTRLGSRLSAVFLVCVVVACKNDLDRVAAVEVKDDAPDRTTYNAEYLYTDSGVIRDRLSAGRIEEYMVKDNRHTELSEGVELRFYDAEGEPGSVLTAKKGTILPDEGRMIVRDDVVFVNPKGERLETERLVWSQDSDRVYTDRPVRIARGKDVIHGVGLDANADFTRYRIKQITGTLYLEDGDTLAGDAQVE